MVQLKLQGPIIGKLSKQWGPSLSDCLEIEAIFHYGVADKGTWKSVSYVYDYVLIYLYVMYIKYL